MPRPAPRSRFRDPVVSLLGREEDLPSSDRHRGAGGREKYAVWEWFGCGYCAARGRDGGAGRGGGSLYGGGSAVKERERLRYNLPVTGIKGIVM